MELSIDLISELRDNQERKKQKVLDDFEVISYNMQNLIFALENKEKKCEELEYQLEIYNSFSIEKKLEKLETLSRGLIRENERISNDLNESKAINTFLQKKVKQMEDDRKDLNEILEENRNLKVFYMCIHIYYF